MKLEVFKRIFELYKENEKFLDDTKNVLKLDLSETVSNDCFWETLSLIWDNEYTEEGVDWINWYMFEKRENGTPSAWDKDGTPILNSLEELWSFVESDHKLNQIALDASHNSGYEEGYAEGVASQRNT